MFLLVNYLLPKQKSIRRVMNTVVPDLGLKHHGQPNDRGYYPRAGITLRMSPLPTAPQLNH